MISFFINSISSLPRLIKYSGIYANLTARLKKPDLNFSLYAPSFCKNLPTHKNGRLSNKSRN